MLKRWAVISAIAVAFLLGYFGANRHATVEGQAVPESGAAVPGDVGNMELTGPYDVVGDWPKDLSTLPGNSKWTWGSGEGIFAESPNRVFVLQRGELPVIPRAGRGANNPYAKVNEMLHGIAPGADYPIMNIYRNATG